MSPCEVCREPAPTCEHNATYCEAMRAWREYYDALIGEQQADDWAIDARREGP